MLARGLYSLANVEEMCDNCVGPRGYLPPPAFLHLRSLRSFNYVVLLLVAVVAAGSVASEARDRAKAMLFCMRHPWDPSSCAIGTEPPDVPAHWFAKQFLCARRLAPAPSVV